MVDEDNYKRLMGVREFMDDCYGMPLTLDQISREACISPFHFHRLFKQAFEKTPHQYLTDRRIRKAKELLKSKPSSRTTAGTGSA